MPVITLITDFGLKDHYVSSVKGAILNELPTVTIVDIAHQVEKHNIQEAAFILKNAYPNFPKGTIHIIGVKTEHNKDSSHVIVYSNGHYFIGSDNGIFSLLLEDRMEKIIGLPLNDSIYPTRDVFVKVACELAKGKPMEELGTPKTDLIERIPFRAASIGDMIKGTVEYIDSYGNVITNIQRNLYEQVGKGRAMTIELKRNTINNLSLSYNDVPEGEVLALFNSSGSLIIAINNGKADGLLHLKLTDAITVYFQ